MRIKKLFLLLMLMCCMTSQVVMASASTVREDIAFLGETPENDIFGGVTNVVQDIGASTVRLVRAGGIAVIVIAVLVAAVGLALTKNGTGQNDKKTRFVFLIIGAIIFFGGTAVVIWAGDIGAALTNAAATSVTPTPIPRW